MSGIFSDSEIELIDAAKIVLSDGVRRLMGRTALFPTVRGRSARADCRQARTALTDKLVADYGALRYEMAAAVMIDAQGRLIAIEEFPRGDSAMVRICPRILAGWIVTHGAVAVLLAHNHPSGDNTPSDQDVTSTDHFRQWLKFMRVDLLDHIVLSGEGASSIGGDWL